MEPAFLGPGRGGEFRSMTHCGVGGELPVEVLCDIITLYMNTRMEILETRNSSAGCHIQDTPSFGVWRR